MRLHPREQLINEADIDLRTAISEWGKKHKDLTTPEYIKVLLGVCTDDLQTLLKYVIREERHGNSDKPGGTQ